MSPGRRELLLLVIGGVKVSCEDQRRLILVAVVTVVEVVVGKKRWK